MDRSLVLLDCSLSATAENVNRVRRMLDRSLDPFGFAAQLCHDLGLAFSEACTNAVRHGSPCGSRNRFHVRCVLRDHCLVMEVRDEGRGFTPILPPVLPDPIDDPGGGRGLYLMYYLMDKRLEVLPCCPRGTLVRMIKELC